MPNIVPLKKIPCKKCSGKLHGIKIRVPRKGYWEEGKGLELITYLPLFRLSISGIYFKSLFSDTNLLHTFINLYAVIFKSTLAIMNDGYQMVL